jgi:hypothetical protein
VWAKPAAGGGLSAAQRAELGELLGSGSVTLADALEVCTDEGIEVRSRSL